MERTFGTTCHGAGRAMSRTAAVKDAAGRRIDKELEARGVIAMAQSRKGLAEEQPRAYKNVDDVVEVVHEAGLSQQGRADAADRRHQGVSKPTRGHGWAWASPFLLTPENPKSHNDRCRPEHGPRARTRPG